MNKINAERKAKFLNSFVRTGNIEYQVREIPVQRRSYNDDDQDLREPQFKVMQVVRVQDNSLVQWVAY